MTKDIVLHADATFGVKLKVSDNVKQGEELGVSHTGGVLISPVAGTVSDISFNPEEHTFLIRIKRSFEGHKVKNSKGDF